MWPLEEKTYSPALVSFSSCVSDIVSDSPRRICAASSSNRADMLPLGQARLEQNLTRQPAPPPLIAIITHSHLLTSLIKNKPHLLLPSTPQRQAGTIRKIIAELSFDFWRFLLSRHYQASIWPQVKRTLKKTPDSRQQFEELVVVVYEMRNRCSHHESIVHQHDRAREVAHLNSVDNAIQKVASFIDPHAAAWIKDNSLVSAIRAQRP